MRCGLRVYLGQIVRQIYLVLFETQIAIQHQSGVSAAGGRVSSWRFSDVSAGFKEGEGSIWTAAEIAEHFASVRR